jgi:hypothetical protein
MQKNASMKRGVIISIVMVLFILLSATLLLFTPKTLAAENVEVNDEFVRVVLGSYKNTQAVDSTNYINQRESIIDRNETAKTSAMSKALLTFSEYKEMNDIQSLLLSNKEATNTTITEVYMWVPGNTGRAIIVVNDNDIFASVKNYINMIRDDKDSCADLLNDIDSLEKYGKIFAVTVTAPNSVLANIAESDQVFVDLFQHDEAAEYAENNHKNLEFICIPDKPDNCF